MKKNNMTDAMTFEEAMARLEDIVKRLEAGGTGLDESLSAFQEGVSLVKLCNDKLTQAEKAVHILKETPDGISEEPFSPDVSRGEVC